MQHLTFNKIIASLILCGAFILMNGCTEKEDNIDRVPQIAFVEMNPETATQFEDSIIIRVSYTDNDGDLGHENPDSLSVFVLDNRLTTADRYYLSPLTPNGEELKIKGVFRIKIANTFLIGNGGEEQTYYTIWLKDRAGNKSNSILTSTLTIKP